jgi:ribonuclease D
MREEALVDVLNAILKLKADEHSITPLNLASRKQLEDVLQGELDVPLMQGWRYKHGGREVEAFLQGEHSLQVRQAELSLV